MAKQTKKTSATPTSTERISRLKDDVARQHHKFIASNPKAPLKDLRDRLRLAVEQCEWLIELSDDARIKDWEEIPEPLAAELAEWDNTEDYCTFEYRQPNLEELVWEVEELIEEVGPRFRLHRLPKWVPSSAGKAAQAS